MPRRLFLPPLARAALPQTKFGGSTIIIIVIPGTSYEVLLGGLFPPRFCFSEVHPRFFSVRNYLDLELGSDVG